MLCEIAIAACDLAEVIGSAVALNLLFKIPLVVGVVLTAMDVLIVLYLQKKGFRYIEALVAALIAVTGISFLYELIVSNPSIIGILGGFVPDPQIVVNPSMLYIAIGILGARQSCNICVDGCDEWISMHDNNISHEIRFAKGLIIVPITKLQNKLAQLRVEFNK